MCLNCLNLIQNGLDRFKKVASEMETTLLNLTRVYLDVISVFLNSSSLEKSFRKTFFQTNVIAP